MTEIKLERKPGRQLAWLWAFVAALVLVLIALWWWGEQQEEDEVVDRVTTVAPEERTPAPPVGIEPAPPPPPSDQAREPRPSAATGAIPVAAILDNPEQWTGRTVSGVVDVGSVPTDRGFWIEEQGKRLFVVIEPRAEETPYEVKAGTKVRIRRATVRRAEERDQVEGELSQETKDILKDQQVFLVVDGPDVEVLQA